MHQIITKQQSFEPAAQVAAGAVSAIANSSQWPVVQRLSVLSHLENIIIETRESLKTEQASARVNELGAPSAPSSSSSSPLRARPSLPIFKCMVFGAQNVGKSAWINLAKMQLEAFPFSTPNTPFSTEIVYRIVSGPVIHFSLWEVDPFKSLEEQESLWYALDSHLSTVESELSLS